VITVVVVPIVMSSILEMTFVATAYKTLPRIGAGASALTAVPAMLPTVSGKSRSGAEAQKSA